MSETGKVTFSVQEYADIRESLFRMGNEEGRQRERADTIRRIERVRRSAESSGGVWVLPVFEPINATGFSEPRRISEKSVLIAEFTVTQLRALETLIGGRSEP